MPVNKMATQYVELRMMLVLVLVLVLELVGLARDLRHSVKRLFTTFCNPHRSENLKPLLHILFEELHEECF
jgi:hypothetical protein